MILFLLDVVGKHRALSGFDHLISGAGVSLGIPQELVCFVGGGALPKTLGKTILENYGYLFLWEI